MIMKSIKKILLFFFIAVNIGVSGQADGHMGYWPFNGNADDESGNNNHGTVNGAKLTSDRFNKNNSAFYFNGVADYIELANKIDVSQYDEWSAAAWVLHEEIDGVKIAILSGYSLQIQQTSMRIASYDGASYKFSEGSIETGKWQHVAITVNKTSGKIYFYINGQPSGSSDYDGSYEALTRINKIGTFNTAAPSNFLFKGKLDDIHIYSRSLSGEEVSELYESERVPSIDDYIGYWPFDGNADDIGPNGLNGTINGTVEPTEDQSLTGDKALEFDGNGGYISVPDHDVLDLTSKFSFSAWMNITDDSTHHPIVVKATNETGYYLVVNYHDGMFFRVWNGEDYETALLTYYNDYYGSWHQITVTYDSGEITLYIDGKPISSHIFESGLAAAVNDHELYIGKSTTGYWGGGNTLNGKLNGLKIYSRALSPREVSMLYESEKGPEINDHIGYWPFNGNANDESGNANHGEESGATLATDRFGKENSAYHFDGIDDYIQLGNAEDFNFSANQDFTLSVWIKPEEGQSDYAGILTNGATADYNRGWALRYIKNKMSFSQSNGEDQRAYANYVAQFGRWSNITVVSDRDGAAKLYKDGDLMGSVDISGFNVDLSNAINTYVGKWGGYYFKGAIDDIHIYNRSLSEQEVSMLYESEKGPEINDHIGYWPFNGNANDESGNANHGEESGVTLATDRFNNENSAYKFDGNDYIILGGGNVLDAETTEKTFSAWVKLEEHPSHQMSIISKGSKEGDNNFNLCIEPDGRARFWYNKQQLIFSTSNPCDGKWHHILATTNGQTNKLYIDGALEAQLGVSTVAGKSGAPVYVGTWDGMTNSLTFIGSIDDIHIYNRSLSEQEVTMLYESEKGPEINDHIGYWPFNGNANDESGNANHGEESGATLATDRFGKENSAYSFDGVDDYIEVPNCDGLNFGEGDFTISTWVKYEGNNGDWQAIVNKGGAGSVGYGLDISRTENFSASIQSESGTNQHVIGPKAAMGEWQQVVGVYDRDKDIKMYIDGVLVKTEPYANGNTNTVSNSFNLLFGRYTANPIWYFNGCIDDIHIYNRPLSEQEVSMLYESEKGPEINDHIGYWPFNGNANDESANDNHGTVNGATLATDRFGKENSAYSFDGEGDRVNIVHSDEISIKSNMCFSFWLKMDETGTNKRVLSKYTNNSGYEIFIRYNTVVFRSYGPNGNVQSSSNNVIYENEWNHVVVVIKGGRPGFIINGRDEGNEIMTGHEYVPSTVNLKVGESQVGTYPMTGTIDDIHIYNRPLSEQEVTMLYESEKGPEINDHIGYWPFNGNANDESGNANHGQESGATLATDRFGNENSAYSFDGVDDYLKLDQEYSFSQTDAWSISLWFDWKGPSINGGQTFLFGTESGAANFFALKYHSTSKFALRNNAYDHYYYETETLQDIYQKGWKHLLVSADGQGNLSAYVDGVLIESIPAVTSFVLDAFGKAYHLSDFCFNGSLDDIRVYDRALSPQEATMLYESETPEIYPIEGFTATSEKCAGTKLSWNGPVDGATGIKAERSENNGEYTEIAQLGPTDTCYTDATVLPEQEYKYRLVAYNSNSSVTSEGLTISTIGYSDLYLSQQEVGWDELVDITIQGDDFIRNGQHTHRAVFRSKNILEELENGYFEFTVNNKNNRSGIGLSTRKGERTELNNLDYAIYFNSNYLYIYRSGQRVLQNLPYEVGDYFRMERTNNGSAIVVYQNCNEVYRFDTDRNEILYITGLIEDSGAANFGKVRSNIKSIDDIKRSDFFGELYWINLRRLRLDEQENLVNPEGRGTAISANEFNPQNENIQFELDYLRDNSPFNPFQEPSLSIGFTPETEAHGEGGFFSGIKIENGRVMILEHGSVGQSFDLSYEDKITVGVENSVFRLSINGQQEYTSGSPLPNFSFRLGLVLENGTQLNRGQLTCNMPVKVPYMEKGYEIIWENGEALNVPRPFEESLVEFTLNHHSLDHGGFLEMMGIRIDFMEGERYSFSSDQFREEFAYQNMDRLAIYFDNEYVQLWQNNKLILLQERMVEYEGIKNSFAELEAVASFPVPATYFSSMKMPVIWEQLSGIEISENKIEKVNDSWSGMISSNCLEQGEGGYFECTIINMENYSAIGFSPSINSNSDHFDYEIKFNKNKYNIRVEGQSFLSDLPFETGDIFRMELTREGQLLKVYKNYIQVASIRVNNYDKKYFITGYVQNPGIANFANVTTSMDLPEYEIDWDKFNNIDVQESETYKIFSPVSGIPHETWSDVSAMATGNKLFVNQDGYIEIELDGVRDCAVGLMDNTKQSFNYQDIDYAMFYDRDNSTLYAYENGNQVILEESVNRIGNTDCKIMRVGSTIYYIKGSEILRKIATNPGLELIPHLNIYSGSFNTDNAKVTVPNLQEIFDVEWETLQGITENGDALIGSGSIYGGAVAFNRFESGGSVSLSFVLGTAENEAYIGFENNYGIRFKSDGSVEVVTDDGTRTFNYEVNDLIKLEFDQGQRKFIVSRNNNIIAKRSSNYLYGELTINSYGAFNFKDIKASVPPENNYRGYQVYWTKYLGVETDIYSPTHLRKVTETGWGNTVASSFHHLHANEDGSLIFAVEGDDNENAAIGLSERAKNKHETPVENAFYLENGNIHIYESGVDLGIFGRYTLQERYDDDKKTFRITRLRDKISYWYGGKRLRQVTVDPNKEMVADVSVYKKGAQVYDVGATFGSYNLPQKYYGVYWAEVLGASASGARLTKTAETGWGNAGAVARNVLNHWRKESMMFKTSSDDNRNQNSYIGLSYENTGAAHTSIDFAYYLSGGTIHIYEKGQLVGTFGEYTPYDMLEIERDNDEIYYLKNGIELRHTSAETDRNLLIDAALNETGSFVYVQATVQVYRPYYKKGEEPVEYSVTANENINYIHTVTPRVPVQSFNFNASRKNDEVSESIKYFDELGRDLQVIDIMASPAQKDVIQPVVYDVLGRIEKEYLPYTDDGFGDYHSNAIIDDPETVGEQEEFYSTLFGGADGQYAYSQKRFDGSPLNRVLEQSSPGKNWAMENGHTVMNGYTTNTSTVNSWIYNGDARTSVTFPVNSLFVSETYGENYNPENGDGHITLEYKDKEGKLIQTEVMLDDGTALRTKYLYDHLGNLRCVIPPKATSPNDAELCYYYYYDEKQRLIEKKLPGAEAAYMVYDKRDRLVATQDGNMRAGNKSEWLFTKYDAYDRPVLTGIIEKTGITDQLEMQKKADVAPELNMRFEGNLNTLLLGYMGWGFPACSQDPIPEMNLFKLKHYLTSTYYDNYDALNGVPGYGYRNPASQGLDEAYNFSPKASYNNIGLQTITKTLILESGNSNSSDYLITVTYYDEYDRPVQVVADNHLGGKDIISNKYNFAGEVLATIHEHTTRKEDGTLIADINVGERFEYDHAGRLLESWHQVEGNKEVMITANKYNELGEIVTKYNHGSGNGSSTYILQKTDYAYNIKGWLTKINDPDNHLLISNFKLFAMELYYHDASALSTLSPTEQHNGNISAIRWRDAAAGVQKGYGFNYDEVNRLKKADYGTNNGSWLKSPNYSVPNIVYDANGNIEELQRTGASGLIDNLEYTYENGENSNRLSFVEDAGTNDGFKGINSGIAEYTYDANGNLIKDKNKNISINYNILNLPNRVEHENAQAIYSLLTYDAAGNKLCKEHYEHSDYLSTYRYYVSGFEYVRKKDYDAGQLVEDSYRLQQLNTSEGRVIFSGDAIKYEYHLTDHLGNTRVVFADDNKDGFIEAPEISQVSDYYPFGMKHEIEEQPNDADQKYLYNGKELQDETGWYDFGLRQYDPMLGMWHVLDPAAEEYYSQSGYHYVANNPVNVVDPDGACYTCNSNDYQTGATTWENGVNWYYNGGGNWTNVTNWYHGFVNYVDGGATEVWSKQNIWANLYTWQGSSKGNYYPFSLESLQVYNSVLENDGYNPITTAARKFNPYSEPAKGSEAYEYWGHTMYHFRAAGKYIQNASFLSAASFGGGSQRTPTQFKMQTRFNGYGAAKGGGLTDNLVRVRHHTSRYGLKGIKNSNQITASGRNKPYGVHFEVEPFMNPTKVNLGQFGRGSYVEFSVPRSTISNIPGYMGGAGNAGYKVTGGAPLNLTGTAPRFVRWNWLGF